jgi:hypothetical protein
MKQYILAFSFFSLVPVVLPGLGALLGFLGMQEDAKEPAKATNGMPRTEGCAVCR